MLVLCHDRWLSEKEDVETEIVTGESALWSSLAAVAESKSGSKLMGRVAVLAKSVVALEIVKFEISEALNLIVVPRL